MSKPNWSLETVQDIEDVVTYVDPTQSLLAQYFIGTFEYFSGRERLRALGTDLMNERLDQSELRANIFSDMLKKLDILLDYNPEPLRLVPETGPVLFVANHPFGAIDGIALTSLCLEIRPDTKVLGIDALCRLKEVKPFFFPVSLGDSQESVRTTVRARKSAYEHLRSGRPIIIFPAGGIAATRSVFKSIALDLPWIKFASKLAMLPGVSTVPFYFEGRNSRLFQIASRIGGRTRAALICYESVRLIGKTLRFSIGAPIKSEELRGLPDRQSVALELRRRTFALANRPEINWMQDPAACS